MTFKVFVFGSMIPAIVCLGYAWRVLLMDRTETAGRGWRGHALIAALCFACLSQLLVLGFLLHGFHPDSQSFAEPAPLPWVVANWITVIG